MRLLSAERVGARTPQLRLAPDYVSSSGLEVVELAATVGLHMDPWQSDILTDGLGERSDGTWSAREVGDVVPRQNGKGSIFEARELGGLILFGEKLIVHTAHEVKTAMEAFRRITGLFTNYDDLRRRVRRVSNQNGEEGIELLTGARLRFLARSKGAGRGFTADCLIWDEAYALTDDQVDAQMPVLSAVANHQIWYGSSPPLNSVDGQVLMRLRRRAQAGAPRLVFYDWGRQDIDLSMLKDLARDGTFDLDDVEHAYAANPALGAERQSAITEETVRAEREAMSDEGYARERLCIWPKDMAADFQVIGEDAWEARLDRLSRVSGVFALSVAVSVDRSRGAVCSAGFREDGGAHVEVTSRSGLIDARPGTGWIAGRIKEIVDRRRPCALVIDAGAPQGSLIADIEAKFTDAAGNQTFEVTRIGTGDVARAYGMFYDGVCDEDEDKRDLWHIGQPELTAAVAGGVTRSIGPGATTWDAKNAQVDITPLRAATDALFGLKTYGHLVDGPIELEGRLFGGGGDDD